MSAVPQTYLSRFYFGPFNGTAWQAIHNAAPVAPERRTRAEAERDAASYKVKPAAIWDGTTGHFFPLDAFAAD